MMNEFVYNYVLTAAVIGWCTAQIIKTLLNYIQTKKFHVERLFGAGGMPSSHSAMVCSATVSMCRQCGGDSPEFALMFVMAMIVMYDAMGVRRSAGLHAREINRINRIFAIKEIKTAGESEKKSEEKSEEKKKKELKEYIGHTPLEVLGGALLGILIAMLTPMKIDF